MNYEQIDEGYDTVITEENAYRNVSLQMHQSKSGTWWEVLESCQDEMYKKLFEKLPHADCMHNLVLYTFSDKLFPETLSSFAAGG